MRIWNADGGEVAAAATARAASAGLVMEAAAATPPPGDRRAHPRGQPRRGWRRHRRHGPPGLSWRDIPLAEEMDTRGIELQVGPANAPVLHTPGCVSFGNPHVVFFVADAAAAPVEAVGPMIEHHALFPTAPTSASPRSSPATGSGCGYGSGEWVSPAPAAPPLRRRRRRPSPGTVAGRTVTVEVDGGELWSTGGQRDGHV